MNLRSDYHDTSGVIRLTLTDLILARNHIKVQPGTIGTLHHTFGAEDIVRIDKLLKYFLKFCTLEFVRCLLAPAGKYIICMMMVMVMMNSFAQLYEYRREISDLRTKQEQLDAEAVRLNGLLEARDDIRTVEQIATEKIGMVSSDLVESRFVSLADYDRVELKDTGDSENTGAFSTLLSAIGENLGKISEYFN